MNTSTNMLASVACNGGSTLCSAVEESVFSEGCAAIQAAYPEGIYTCSYGCLGGGTCVRSCKFKAIRLDENHIARIDRTLCTGCGDCVSACPQKIIHLLPCENVITVRCSNQAAGAVARKNCQTACIACRICENNCPADAIHVVDNCAEIEQSRCIVCGMCAVKCPRNTIFDEDGIFN